MNVPSGAALVYVGQTIQIYDSTLTTNRGTANVVACDPITAQTITVDVVPAGTVVGDLLVHDGLSGAQPVSLFGIKYHQNNATTGTWMNLNRATYPVQLATPRVNGGNAALTPANVRLAINKVRKSLGINQVGKLIAYTSVEQEHAWENLGISISQIIKEGGATSGNGDLDLLFTGRKTMSGVPIKSSVNADQTRVDFLDLSHWGRAVMKDIDFFEIGGQTVFPIYGASGGLAASYIFYFDTGFQVFDDSPRSGAYIDMRWRGRRDTKRKCSPGRFGSPGVLACQCSTQETNTPMFSVVCVFLGEQLQILPLGISISSRATGNPQGFKTP